MSKAVVNQILVAMVASVAAAIIVDQLKKRGYIS